MKRVQDTNTPHKVDNQTTCIYREQTLWLDTVSTGRVEIIVKADLTTFYLLREHLLSKYWFTHVEWWVRETHGFPITETSLSSGRADKNDIWE